MILLFIFSYDFTTVLFLSVLRVLFPVFSCEVSVPAQVPSPHVYGQSPCCPILPGMHQGTQLCPVASNQQATVFKLGVVLCSLVGSLPSSRHTFHRFLVLGFPGTRQTPGHSVFRRLFYLLVVQPLRVVFCFPF